MPPLPLRSGARARSDRCQCWVWSRVGELGRRSLNKEAKWPAPAPFWGLPNRITAPPDPPRTRVPPCLLSSPLWGEVPKAEGGSPANKKNRPTPLQAAGRPILKSELAMAYFPQGVAPPVSSALRRFTSVFGMGTGGATALQSPAHGKSYHENARRSCYVDHTNEGRSRR